LGRRCMHALLKYRLISCMHRQFDWSCALRSPSPPSLPACCALLLRHARHHFGHSVTL